MFLRPVAWNFFEKVGIGVKTLRLFDCHFAGTFDVRLYCGDGAHRLRHCA